MAYSTSVRFFTLHLTSVFESVPFVPPSLHSPISHSTSTSISLICQLFCTCVLTHAHCLPVSRSAENRYHCAIAMSVVEIARLRGSSVKGHHVYRTYFSVGAVFDCKRELHNHSNPRTIADCPTSQQHQSGTPVS